MGNTSARIAPGKEERLAQPGGMGRLRGLAQRVEKTGHSIEVNRMFLDRQFAFRFLSLSDREVEKFQQLLPRVEFVKRHREKSFVISFDIDESFDLDALCVFIDEVQPDSTSYGVWISLVASGDQGGVSLPKHLLDAIRRTFGSVDFSFVACLDGDDQESIKRRI